MYTLLYSLRFRVLVFSLAMLAILGGSILYNGYRVIHHALLDSVNASIKQTSQILNLAVSPYAFNNELKQLDVYLSELLLTEETLGKRSLLYVAIAKEDGFPLLVVGIPANQTILPAPDLETDYAVALERGFLNIRQPILLTGNTVGFLQYGLSFERMQQANRESLQQGAILVGVSLFVCATFILFFGIPFARRIGMLIHVCEAMSEGNYQHSAAEQGRDEISQLAHYFNIMAAAICQRIHALEKSRTQIAQLNQGLEQRVNERTQELAKVNQTLEQTIDHLKQTQDSLIISEKLASLGALVAGIAHELNTPIGNTLMVASTLQDKTYLFTQEIETGIKRSSLNNFLDEVLESSPLLVRNLTRAADLITSFKHVAVDQSSSQRRIFNLHDIIQEVSDMLRHTFSKTPFLLAIDVPKDIVLDSYPGPLGQVLTNLINNALIHAFVDRQQGIMRIVARRDIPDWIVIEFSDDGVGISAENLKHIFDPFFTTRLGQGGSGLGLNLVHNIVEGLLGGQLQVRSTLGISTCFTFKIPCIAPVFNVNVSSQN